MMKLLSLRFVAVSFGSLFFYFPQFSVAQATLNALTYPPYPGGVSYFPDMVYYYYYGDVGWSFVPTSDMQVIAILSPAPQVSFWLGTNQLISTYNITASPINFQTIPPLLLSAGQMYSVSVQCSNTDFPVYPSGTGTDDASFAISPYIHQFESYFGAPSNQVETTSSSLVGGPNFQFEVVPEPVLQPVGFGTNGFFQIQMSNGLTNLNYVLQCSTNFSGWISLSTNLVSTNLASVILTDTSPSLLGARFYRVLCQ